jgi:AcrR family transcriptional regulator
MWIGMPTRTTPAQLKRRWQAANRAQRLELIVEAALDLLSRRDLEAVTMRAVAARLGVGAMTLYTYVSSQQQMRREMIRRGFEMLNNSCDQSPAEHPVENDWRYGAELYVNFALANPNLYRLMFSTSSITGDDLELVRGGFQTLLDHVREELCRQGVQGRDLQQQASEKAGRFWIALHGLASLVIDGRLSIIGSDLSALLDDLVRRVAPNT